MKWARAGVLTLLVIEGIGGVVLGALTAIIGESITPGYVPWTFAAGPLVFGIAALAVTFIYWRRLPIGKYLALVLQVIVAAGAATALVSSAEPSLWLALAVGLAGTVMVILDSSSVSGAHPEGTPRQ